MKKDRKPQIMKRQGMMLVLVLLGLSLWFGSNALAQDTAASRPCAEDLQKFCKDVTPGGGRIAACLKEHASELTAVCKADIEAMGKKMKNVHDACRDDLDKFCKDVMPGGGRIIKCIKAHENELSAECKEKISQAKHR